MLWLIINDKAQNKDLCRRRRKFGVCLSLFCGFSLQGQLRVAEEEFGESPFPQRRPMPQRIPSLRGDSTPDSIPVMTSTPLNNERARVKTVERSAPNKDKPEVADSTAVVFQQSLVERRNRIRPGSM